MSTMSLNANPIDAGGQAPFLRLFGWGMLAVLAAYLLENILVVWFQFEGARAILHGGGLASSAVYVACVAVAFGHVLAGAPRSLRRDAARINAFNAYLVRSLFWAVLLIGLVDGTIALLRAEDALILLFDEETAQALGRVHYIAPHIHAPLIVAGFVIGLFTRTLGFTWLALLIVAAELLIVLSRFVFSYEQALMSDLVRYWYAALFLFASAYTLFDEGHVRVDVLYATFPPRRRGAVNMVGATLLGMTTCWVILDVGLAGKTAIINSPVASFEISTSGSNGMYVKYQMAAFLAIFAATMLIQFVSQLFEAVADRRGEPGRREATPVAH